MNRTLQTQLPALDDFGADETDRLAIEDLEHPESVPFEIVTTSPAMQPVLESIVEVAATSRTVLLTGESGTGKERVARSIHRLSPRSSGPFLALDCAAVPGSWIEEELFGPQPSGPTRSGLGDPPEPGLLARAEGGTLYLDEVDELGPELQARLLDAVKPRELDRARDRRGDVRLITAVRFDPRALMNAGRLRQAFRDQVAIVTIALPRLAERAGDLELLTGHFLRGFGRKYGKHFTGISDRALALLREHAWVGNVRELRDVLEAVAVTAPGGTLREADLPATWHAGDPARPREAHHLPTLFEMERRHIERAVASARGHLGRAAELLGIHRNTLTRKLSRIVALAPAAERADLVHPLDHEPFNRHRS